MGALATYPAAWTVVMDQVGAVREKPIDWNFGAPELALYDYVHVDYQP